jgi:hypothetical protein
MQIYVKVKTNNVSLGADWSIPDKMKMMVRLISETLEPLKKHISENWPDLPYAPSNVTTSLIIFVNDGRPIHDMVVSLRQLEYVELAEVIND